VDLLQWMAADAEINFFPQKNGFLIGHDSNAAIDGMTIDVFI